MTQLSKYADEVITAVKGYVERAYAKLEAKVEDRIKTIEDRPIPKGEKGDQGERGEQGEQGSAGADGTVGPRGEAGERGEKGESGERGERGMDGADGKPGERGETGERGEKGDPGERGERGEQGPPGRDGADGAPGPIGERGEKGIDGRDGLEGPPGKDALQIEVLPDIDPEKKYRRNTYAAFKGGMIRSFRATDPITKDLESAGWHVVMNGIESAESSMDGKTLNITVKMTDGRSFVQKTLVPVVVYRGIYRDDEEYDLGDMVTRDGCTWHLGAEQKG